MLLAAGGKKPDVVNTNSVLHHVGIVNRPPARPGYLSFTHPTTLEAILEANSASSDLFRQIDIALRTTLYHHAPQSWFGFNHVHDDKNRFAGLYVLDLGVFHVETHHRIA